MDITGELQRNRETISGVRGHIADTSGALGTARSLINSMQKREVQQKAILGFVASVAGPAQGRHFEPGRSEAAGWHNVVFVSMRNGRMAVLNEKYVEFVFNVFESVKTISI